MQLLYFSFLQKKEIPSAHKINQLSFGMQSAIYRARLNEKGDKKMNTTISRKTTYIGAGAGIVLFAIFGLLPGSLLGGAAGIKLAGMFFGLPLDPGIISRAIVLASMLVGIIVAGITIVTATSTMGWLVGRVLEGGHASEKASMANSK
jgi:O-antigen/teichoic acid export membrane protein